MTDIRLIMDSDAQALDLVLSGAELELDDGLQTAVLVSLFSDRRAADDEAVGDGDRRGWWGDVYPAVEGDRTGSRLWLLRRAKATAETAAKIREYAREALAWLVEDGVAASIEAEAEVVGLGRIDWSVAIYRPAAGAPARFPFVWSNS